jgi:hypothetical protein
LFHGNRNRTDAVSNRITDEHGPNKDFGADKNVERTLMLQPIYNISTMSRLGGQAGPEGDSSSTYRRFIGPAEFGVSDEGHRNYIAALRRVIVELHGCSAEHDETVRIHESFLDRILREGSVEVFELVGHPLARTCYAWAERIEGRTRFFAILGSHIIRSAREAVKYASVVTSAHLIKEFSRSADDGPPGEPAPERPSDSPG